MTETAMPKTYTRRDFENILAQNISMGQSAVDLYANDFYTDGNETVRVGDMLSAIKKVSGVDYEHFLKLPVSKQRRYAREAKIRLRQQKREERRAAQREDHETIAPIEPWMRTDRPLQVREDDIINIHGESALAIDVNDKMHEAVTWFLQSPRSKNLPTQDALIEHAMTLLRQEGILMKKRPHHPDNAVVYCGTGRYIEKCIIQPMAEKPDQLTAVLSTDPEAEKLFGAQKKLTKLRREHAAQSAEEAEWHAKLIETTQYLDSWIAKGQFKIEKPQGSSIHHLAEYSRQHGEGRFWESIQPGNYMSDLQDFVIEHNWAAAFSGATNFDGGEIRLPYNNCSYEFRIDGIRCIFFYRQDDGGTINCDTVVFGLNNYWIAAPYNYTVGPNNYLLIERSKTMADAYIDLHTPTEECRPLFDLAHRQIRACAIMLEAKVAETELIRAPSRLNEKREKLGRTKLRDHHVVVLSKRHRSNPVPAELRGAVEDKRSSPRLHFRCGHWRHYTNHRTWIEWQLVGDPDLGFVEKHYRL